jgi:hypothetical protein
MRNRRPLASSVLSSPVFAALAFAVSVAPLGCSSSDEASTTDLGSVADAAPVDDDTPGSTGDVGPADAGDVAADAHTVAVQDVAPDPDTAALDTGPDKDVATHPSTGPRAYVLGAADTDVIGSGRMADARPGDVVLRNDVIRVVIRTGPEALYMAGIGGGAIIDAVPDDQPPQADELQEHLPLLQFHAVGPEGAVAITNAGDGEGAEVTYTGYGKVPALIGEFIWGLQVEKLAMTISYRLEAGSRVVRIKQSIMGQDTAQTAMVQFPGGRLDVTNDMVNGWVAQSGPHVAYGLLAFEPLTVAEFGGLTLLLGPNVNADVPGGKTEWTSWLVVGTGGLSTVLDEMYSLRNLPTGQLAGQVDDPAVEIAARDASGVLVSRFRPDATGAFAGTLPVGLYTLTAEGPGRLPGTPVAADVTSATPLSALALTASAPATLVVTVPEATRLTIDGKTVPVPPGETRVPIAPGDHTIWASRGFEYETDKLVVTLGAGEERVWAPVVTRVVDTAGWIGADFHLHSEWSVDSNVPLAMRVLACSAEGIEYAVATDHDVITDYSVELPPSLEGRLLIGQGVETSTARFGHINSWPRVQDKSKAGRGSPRWQGLEFGPLMDLLAPEDAGRIVQINHGRGNKGSQTFTQLTYDPTDPDPTLIADFRFNAMELFNDGGGAMNELLVDWFSFINQGLSVAGTGVSDSHSLSARCGHARTWVEVPSDDLSTLTPAVADQGVLLRRTIASNGPFITLEARPNNTVHVRVAGPSWMPIETIRIYADGVVDTNIAVPPYAGDPVRYDADVVLSAPNAHWSVAVAEAAGNAAPIANHQIRGVSPAAWLQPLTP